MRGRSRLRRRRISLPLTPALSPLAGSGRHEAMKSARYSIDRRVAECLRNLRAKYEVGRAIVSACHIVPPGDGALGCAA